MDHVLLDMDVVLDILLDREPYSLYSTKVFRLCEAKKIKGYITPLTYSNVYYILRRNSKHEKVIAALKQLLSITNVLSMDSDIVTNALYSSSTILKMGYNIIQR
jgi:predicted nucleic acid-binding protein